MKSIRKWLDDRLNPILSDRTICKMVQEGKLLQTPITPGQLQPNSLDLQLGDTYCIPTANITGTEFEPDYIDPKKVCEYEYGSFEKDDRGNKFYLLPPRQFTLFTTKDILCIPSGIMGFVQGRSSVARLGIQVEQAGLVDSGFHGSITLEIENQSEHPIKLYADMRIAQIWFVRCQHPNHLYGFNIGSKYLFQEDATGSRIWKDFR